MCYSAEEERINRAEKLGRIFEPSKADKRSVIT